MNLRLETNFCGEPVTEPKTHTLSVSVHTHTHPTHHVLFNQFNPNQTGTRGGIRFHVEVGSGKRRGQVAAGEIGDAGRGRERHGWCVEERRVGAPCLGMDSEDAMVPRRYDRGQSTTP